MLITGLHTNASGGFTLHSTWPMILPPGFQVWMQVWLRDTSAFAGFAASNGLRGTSQ